MGNQKINEFKKEFSNEINEREIDVELLKTLKISNSVLQAEVFLRKIFGDEIYTPKKIEDEVVGEKAIVKLTEEDMLFDNQVNEITDNIADVEFDNNVGLLLSKLNEEEDE